MRFAIYGCGTNEGLIVIKGKYVDIAMKHEFGHIGLGKHHENCIMDYSCVHNDSVIYVKIK